MRARKKFRNKNVRTDDSSLSTREISSSRKWIFRTVALAAPLLLLVILEFTLRWGGYGYSPDFFKKVQIGNQTFYENSETFSYRFFPPALARFPGPFKIAAEKPGDVRRVFILGESAAMGDPQPSYGASRYLDVLLRERFPDEKFEVVNLGITAINSHVILPIAKECAQRQGDLWIIYMGNNEMVGPFGAATVFSSRAPPLGIVRMNLVIQKTRIGQLAISSFRKLGEKSGGKKSWTGMKMFLQNQIAPTDPRKETVYQNFEGNLRDILKVGQSAGVKIILSTMSVNLRDCPPFGSHSNSNQPAADREQFNRLYAEAVNLESESNFVAAAQKFEQAAPLNPTFAELHFRWGESLLQVTNFSAARDHFQLACDSDALPFRADGRINAIIRASCKKFTGDNFVLCDAESELLAASPVKVAGDESFFEHVHFNFDGNYRLARSWAEQVERMLLPQSRSDQVWATQEECERRLGLTDFNRAYVLQSVMRRMEQPPLSSQFNNAQRLQKMQRLEAQIQEKLKQPDSRAQAREVFRAALSRSPDDHYLYENFGNILESWGDNAEAAGCYRRALELQPQDYYAHLRLGHTLGLLGRFAEASGILSQAAKIRPNLPESWYELGSVQVMQGQLETALKSFERASEMRPEEQTYIYFKIYCAGKLLAQHNNHAAAMEQYGKAIELLPNQWEAHFELGGELDAANRLDEAAREFAAATRLNSGYSRTHFNYGVLLAKQGRLDEAQREFEETIRLEPGNTKAREYIAQLDILRKQKP